MSGTYCGGCGEGNLVRDPAGPGKRPVACDLCGWTADGAELPSEWLEEEPPRTKRARKAAGRLFFLWVDFGPRTPDAASRVMRLLKISGMSVAPRVLIELETKPSPETLEQVRAVEGVTGVRLAP